MSAFLAKAEAIFEQAKAEHWQFEDALEKILDLFISEANAVLDQFDDQASPRLGRKP